MKAKAAIGFDYSDVLAVMEEGIWWPTSHIAAKARLSHESALNRLHAASMDGAVEIDDKTGAYLWRRR